MSKILGWLVHTIAVTKEPALVQLPRVATLMMDAGVISSEYMLVGEKMGKPYTMVM